MPYPLIGSSPMELDEWSDLKRYASELKGATIRGLFEEDPGRAERLRCVAGSAVVDFSKNLIDSSVVGTLVRLARRRGLEDAIDAMWSGRVINTTENRSVLHVALRMQNGPALVVAGSDVVAEVNSVLERMSEFATSVRSGGFRGATGRPIATVVNIGIGGSYLGPEMATYALADYATRDIDFRFVSNIDPAAIASVMESCDPETTLFVVASKTFTTLETMTNARVARQWILDRLGDREDVIAHHFCAVSTNLDLVSGFGIDPANTFGFWDFVGGRYSVDSAVGLSLMVAIGPERFRSFLAGFAEIDAHMRSQPLESNVPVLMGLLAVWYRNFWGAQTQAILPYSERLRRLPAYLQQLVMESNGKSVRLDGNGVEYNTGAVIWGEPGTDGQHAFYQLLHQGTTLIPADIVLFAEPVAGPPDQQDLLFANGVAQAAALAFGRSEADLRAAGVAEEVIPHKRMPGNRPSTVLLFPQLTPRTLGSLIALYEHSVFTQGVIWGIDSFDQWGVELGKEMAADLVGPLVGARAPDISGMDSSTAGLVAAYRRLRGRPNS